MSQAQVDAHFHAVHLIAIVTKLLPDWLPDHLFELMHCLWNSKERRARHVPYSPVADTRRAFCCWRLLFNCITENFVTRYFQCMQGFCHLLPVIDQLINPSRA